MTGPHPSAQVHERSVESDLLLLLLRQLACRRRGLALVLMSATADSALFADYFSRPPGGAGDGAAAGGSPLGRVGLVSIPGFTHPVAEYYLEDALERTGFLIGRNSRRARPRRCAGDALR